MKWNPRYVLWAKKHGLTPEEMTKKDDEDWHGGCMCGFSLWIQERIRALCDHHGVQRDLRALTDVQLDPHKTLDKWLEDSIL